jgi:hypothetical protein
VTSLAKDSFTDFEGIYIPADIGFPWQAYIEKHNSNLSLFMIQAAPPTSLSAAWCILHLWHFLPTTQTTGGAL